MKFLTGLFLVLSLLEAHPVAATKLQDVRFFATDSLVRIVLDLDGFPEYNIWVPRDEPPRIAIDLSNTHLSTTKTSIKVKDSLLTGIRINSLRDDKQQIVLDLKEATHYRAFTLGPDKKNNKPHRLVVDVKKIPSASSPEPTYKDTIATPDTNATVVKKDTVTKELENAPLIKIIIDAGHGGNDPGAVSANGLMEKSVVLNAAELLAKHLRKYPGFKPVLTRGEDKFIPLRDRISTAKKLNGDIFISIHANAVLRNKNAMNGTEIYFLGPKGASDEVTRELVEYENNADLRAGYVSVADVEDSLLAKIIMEAQATEIGMRRSSLLAESIYDQVTKLIKGRGVKQANFVVLKGITLPSVLIEIAYLTHSEDVKLLKDKDFLDDYTAKVARGIANYFEQYGDLGGGEDEGPMYYIVKQGDTLSEIAAQFGVSIESILNANKIKSVNKIKVGQRLEIPTNSQ